MIPRAAYWLERRRHHAHEQGSRRPQRTQRFEQAGFRIAVDHDRIHRLQTRGGFAQGTGGQQPRVAQATRAINDHQFKVARQLQVLQPIVTHDDVGAQPDEAPRAPAVDPAVAAAVKILQQAMETR